MPKILLAYDGSDPARRALERAAGIANAEVTVVSVAPLSLGAGRSAGPVDPTSNLDEHRRELDEAVALLRERGIAAQTREAVGDPADAIVHAAEEGGFDLVVVGTRGRSGVQRFLMGSVSDRVVHHAPCDVLVVR